MVISDKDFIDAVHLNIHAVRLLSGYKPTEFERRISKLVIERFSGTCIECKSVIERMKNLPEQKTFFQKIGGVINDA